MITSSRVLAVVLFVMTVFVVPIEADYLDMYVPLEVCEIILKDERIIEYLHLDEPGRTPVPLSAAFVHPDLTSRHLGYPIKVVPAESGEADSAFQFVKLTKSQDRIEVELVYPIEGVAGLFVLVHQGDTWVIEKRTLWEQ